MINVGDIVEICKTQEIYKESHPERYIGRVTDLVNWGLTPSARRQKNKIAIVRWLGHDDNYTSSVEWPAMLNVTCRCAPTSGDKS